MSNFIRRAAYDQKRKCPVCLKEFWAARHSATYCSAKCRQRAHRKPPLEERLKEFYQEAELALLNLIAISDRGIDGQRAQRMMRALLLKIVSNLTDENRQAFYQQIQDDVFRLYRDRNLSQYRPENDE